jgi:formate hydrogenlyase subunit 6/NADH:ubiquinone oxidoreductase subunit I
MSTDNLTKKDEKLDAVIVENPFHAARLKPKRKGKKPPKLLAVVHQSGCTGCEICIQGCPVDSIELVAGPNPENPQFQQTVEIDLARCIGCQNCSQDCPWETITMYEHNDAFTAWSSETLFSELYVEEETVLAFKNSVTGENK